MLFYVRVQISNRTQDFSVELPRSATVQELKDYFQMKYRYLKRKYKFDFGSQNYYFMGRSLRPHHTLGRCGVTQRDFVLLYLRGAVRPETPLPHRGLVFDESCCPYFKVGDSVEVRDESGVWWDAVLIEILLARRMPPVDEDPVRMYRVRYDKDSLTIERKDYKLENIRWRACYTYKKSELKKDMTVLVNYDVEHPTKIGFWYDFKIECVERTALVGTLFQGATSLQLSLRVRSFKRIMKIEPLKFVSDRTEKEKSAPRPVKMLPRYCDVCSDKGDLCQNCGCQICISRHGDDSLVLCDGCGMGYHLFCLTPVLKAVPDDDWFCPDCVKPTEEVAETPTPFDRGNEGSGRQCSIVPRSHFGAIPGVTVGLCWKLRSQLQEAGVHRKLVSAIHGAINSRKEEKGAYSILLSGRNTTHEDYGEYFFYVGKQDKITNERKLIGGNLALAYNCNAKIDHHYGTTAKDWKAGRPVRVVRSSSAKSNSEYAPAEGYRYDGIYKVVGYRPVIERNGFYVWVFHLRRDDTSPAPWAEGGQQLSIICPDGFSETNNSLDNSFGLPNPTSSTPNPNEHPSIERSSQYSESLDSSSYSELEAIFGGTSDSYKQKYFNSSPPSRSTVKKQFPIEIRKCITADKQNSKLWNTCLQYKEQGVFTQKLSESFACGCCYELLFKPVTTKCAHNFCHNCLDSWFKEGTFNCPNCRENLGQKKKLVVNSNLQKALSFFFKGYELYRT